MTSILKVLFLVTIHFFVKFSGQNDLFPHTGYNIERAIMMIHISYYYVSGCQW